jgi:hypothetical protein
MGRPVSAARARPARRPRRGGAPRPCGSAWSLRHDAQLHAMPRSDTRTRSPPTPGPRRVWKRTLGRGDRLAAPSERETGISTGALPSISSTAVATRKGTGFAFTCQPASGGGGRSRSPCSRRRPGVRVTRARGAPDRGPAARQRAASRSGRARFARAPASPGQGRCWKRDWRVGSATWSEYSW